MVRLKVNGMTCGGCARKVTKAVEAVPSVSRAVVDLGAAEVTVEGGADEGAVRRAIEGAGFRLRAAA